MTKWRCSVCGFIAEGDTPPDICPVCGAPKEAFERIAEGNRTAFDIKDFLKSLHLHPICSHFQNAPLPITALFIAIYLLTGDISFEKAAFYVYTLAVLSAPLTIMAGILDWYLRYDMVHAKIFTQKMILSSLLIFITFPVFTIRFLQPDILTTPDSASSLIYIGGILIQTMIAGRLGYLGGKLVFG